MFLGLKFIIVNKFLDNIIKFNLFQKLHMRLADKPNL